MSLASSLPQIPFKSLQASSPAILTFPSKILELCVFPHCTATHLALSLILSLLCSGMSAEARQRDADKSWNYREQNRKTVNEKARLRMQRKRAELRNAPIEVQLLQAQKARQYRRDYRQCCKAKAVKTCVVKKITARVSAAVPLVRRPLAARSQNHNHEGLSPGFLASAPRRISSHTYNELNYDAEDEESDSDSVPASPPALF
ncbi:hypothetical protein R3P38DRAFT_2763609 [Favolaschia claudopus]|uniref:Uncharacterized protein n=1 Tax=Favolaschia claudopus TaxID=2862362 RepID=A0AAW0DH17_9AGAR